MHLWSELYFFVCAFLAVAGALLTVIAPNPIRGALGLLTMIVSIAGLFLALHAQFLAAIQLIVYAGAIVVLFLFVIMLLGPSATPPHDHKARTSRALSGALFGLLAIGAMALVTHGAHAAKLDFVDPDFGSIDQMGRTLFSYGVVPFELSSALLMIAVVGAVAVARGKEAKQSARTGGPLGGISVDSNTSSPNVPHERMIGEIQHGTAGGE